MYADGEYIMSVSEDAAVEAGLRIGMQLDSDMLLQIERTCIQTRAMSKAYNLLSYGDMSRARLIEKLKHRGFDEDVAALCADRLCMSGYIDDKRYAAALADSYARVKLYGPLRIYRELIRHGIDSADAKAVTDGLCVDWYQNARTLAEGRYKCDVHDIKQRQKLIAALMRAGYDYETAKAVTASADDDGIYE